MDSIKLLDCTLRDGGYVVNTIFGDFVIRGISKKLQEANIDIIELGYIKDCVYKEGSSTFSCFEDLKEILPKEKSIHTKYAVMIEYNTFNLDKLIPSKMSNIDIVRICYFKSDRYKVIEYAKKIKEYGYSIYLQPMNTLGYSDKEIIELIDIANELMPEALYIVDSYGSMYTDDLEHLFNLIHHNLNKQISIGLHSHNNLQLSYMLIQKIIDLSTNKRGVLIDSSVKGIGRGAGNACTELVVNFLNKTQCKNYNLDIILDIYDSYIYNIEKTCPWGYNIPHFISGIYNVHVNNIAYLLNKHNLKTKDIKYIISEIDNSSEKRYDYAKLEELVLSYVSKDVDDLENLNKLKSLISDRKILLMAPGKTIIKHKKQIEDFIKENNPVVIGINSIIPNFKYDFVFYSNKLRYEHSKEKYEKEFNIYNKILTSNIKINNTKKEFIVNYNGLVKRGWKYFDNSTIMCIRLLMKIGYNHLTITGFDGYNENNENNDYVDKDIVINLSKNEKKLINQEIKTMLEDINGLELNFLTPSIYESEK